MLPGMGCFGKVAFVERATMAIMCESQGTVCMTTEDIRWLQRLQNFRKAMAQLDEAIALMATRELSKLEKQGVIQGFEYSYELGWNTLKDYLVWQGIVGLVGSRDTIREAFSKDLIEDGKGWMQMLADRNRTSHTYDEATAEAILHSIRYLHYPLLKALETTLNEKAEAAS
jgi:nucleotidyltransferase substrate binding protein (TIGR01987 family)